MPLFKNDLPRWERMLKVHLKNDKGVPACGESIGSPSTDDPARVECKRCRLIIERKKIATQ
jgi:hypothetical protein